MSIIEPARGTLASSIVARFRSLIDDGLLAPGERIRSVREGALEEGVSKNTMVEAYDQLVALGYLEARRGSGYFVTRIRRSAVPERPAHVVEAVDVVSLLREQLEQHYEVRIGDGRPPPSWMEGSELGRQLGAARARGGKESEIDHGYGSPWGYAPLRERITLLLAERAIHASPAQVLLTQGANHALDLVVRHLLAPGDTVLVDSPGYYPLFGKLKLARVEMIGVRRLGDGPDLDDLTAKAAAHNPKAFFTQSLAHNPTGGSITLPTAHRLLQLAARYGFLVVEDDPFADLLPASSPRLAALDQLERVIYVSSFSKTLSASLRVGYVAASAPVTAALRDLKMVTIVSTSDYIERIVYRLIAGGHYLRHLRRLKARLETAHREAIETLGRLGLALPHTLSGGFYLWAELPRDVDEFELAHAAAGQGIFIAPGSVFLAERNMPAG
ncbi:MAG TPA: PLP-dependent aminotransferase family protein, partial [Gammaproteobacteria bacterium]|nr:PLP-dependent aminotransferase family protein [Gammaproteobacteria bacterium]